MACLKVEGCVHSKDNCDRTSCLYHSEVVVIKDYDTINWVQVASYDSIYLKS
jgi:hypothetical protein